VQGVLGDDGPLLLVITGVPAAGKSTVAQLIAERLDPAVHVRGDVFRRMVVSGRADMTADPTPEALRQLDLRYRLAGQTADAYHRAGFSVVLQDVIIGRPLADLVDRLAATPLYVVTLTPSAEAIARREAGRAKVAYRAEAASIDALAKAVDDEQPPIGMRLDSSYLTAEETADAIMRVAPAEALVRPRVSGPPAGGVERRLGVELVGGGVRLRPLTPADAWTHLAGEDEAMRAGLEFPRASTVADVMAAIRRWQDSWATDGPVRNFGIRRDHDDRLVGNVEVKLLEPGRVNLSYVVFPAWRRSGVATTAARLALAHAHDALGARHATIKVLPWNHASLAVARRLGAREATPAPTAEDDERYIVFDLDLPLA